MHQSFEPRSHFLWPVDFSVFITGCVSIPSSNCLLLNCLMFLSDRYLPFYETLFSNRLWIVIGRLTLSVYFNHVLVLVLMALGIYDQIPTSQVSLVTFLAVFCIISFFCGYLMYVWIEAPFANIIFEVLEKRMTRKTTDTDRDQIEKSKMSTLNNNQSAEKADDAQCYLRRRKSREDLCQ